MRAAVFHEINKPLAIEDVDIDAPKAQEVKVKMAVAGICRSDLHVMRGEALFGKPAILGHEGSGVVTEIGEGVTSVQPGDHVILCFAPHCGQCEACLTGHPNTCDNHLRTGPRMFDGTSRIHLNGTDVMQMGKLGCFGEEAIVPVTGVAKIEPTVSMRAAALIGCCVTTGVGTAIYSAGIVPGSTVAVVGCGGVGLNIVQGARLAGAGMIIAVDINDAVLEFAGRFGATHSVNAKDGDPVKAVKDLTDGKGVHYAFEAYGSAETITVAFDSLRKQGTAVIAGLAPYDEPAPIDGIALVRQEKTLKGAYYGHSKPVIDFYNMLAMYQAGKIDVDGLVTNVWKLDQINEAYEVLERGAVGRAVIDYGVA